jgi:S-adenosylmethionine hydrolase
MARFVTFLSDYGLQDEFVGTCHGVIKRIAPDVQIIDLTHGIPPQNVLHGALVLAKALEYVPPGVHLAVVDPGVGTARRPLVLEDGEGRLYVGPDNGLLVPAAEAGGGIAAAHELANPRYALDRVSRTFHGRDLFAPAAAHLALGVSAAELGPPLDPEVLVRVTIPEAEISSTRIGATTLAVDRFGNVQLNLGRDVLGAPGTRVALDLPDGRRSAVVARTFADVAHGELVVFEDSSGSVSLAVSGGSASAALGLSSGQRIWIESDSPRA